MRLSLQRLALAAVLVTGLLAFGTTQAKAQGYGGYYGGGGYGLGYGGGGYGRGYGGYYGGGGYGQGYGIPTYNYYGNGGHDAQPHLHTKQTPFGTRTYYGVGRHDFRPHGHTETPYGITSYNGGRFSNTQSYSPPTPYIYQPW